MLKRELVAAVLGPAVLAAILWLPAAVFLTVLVGVLAIAADELLAMDEAPTGRWLPLLCLVGVHVAAWNAGPLGLVVAAAAAVWILTTAQLLMPDRPRGALAGAAISCFAVLYLGLGGVSLGWLRTLPGEALGIDLVILLLISIWVGDSGAYYIGKTLGRHRMSPRISPNKTWEGLAGGVVSTYLAAALVTTLLDIKLSWPQLLAVATILAIGAPVGDLLESAVKRASGVKDSSALLPGHGGFLDRTDSIVFSAPLVLAFVAASGLLG